MDYTATQNDATATYHLRGSFTFEDNPRFRAIIQSIPEQKIKSLVVDLAAVDFMDSAALGMLLLLHDEAKQHNARVTVANPVGQVRKLLEISMLDTYLGIKS